MREKVAFQTNVPVTVALAYADGVQVEGRFRDQIMYTPADERVMYVPPGFRTAAQRPSPVVGSRATSMRRPAFVKPFFGSCQPYIRLPTNGRHI